MTTFTNKFTSKTVTPEDWFMALESGEYRRTTGQLKHTSMPLRGRPEEDTYCCLGVLADMCADNEQVGGDGLLKDHLTPTWLKPYDIVYLEDADDGSWGDHVDPQDDIAAWNDGLEVQNEPMFGALLPDLRAAVARREAALAK